MGLEKADFKKNASVVGEVHHHTERLEGVFPRSGKETENGAPRKKSANP